MGSKRKNRRKKKLAAELAKKLAGPGPDDYANWAPKKKANGILTPAEQRQFDAEMNWATRAFTEDLPGPRRITITSIFGEEMGHVAYGRGKKP